MTGESVRSRLALFDENLGKLARIRQEDYETFMRNFETLEATLHLLQVAIQILIDLAVYVSARKGLPAAPTSRSVLEALETAGHLPEGSTVRFGPIFAFRNRVVHLYDRIDPAIVFAILRERRGDLQDLRDLLADLIV